MELWIPITIAAAFLQNLRSVLQKRLTDTLSTWGVTSARFVYAAPLAALLLAGLLVGTGQSAPPPNPTFVISGLLGGLAQILATGLLIHLFSYKNFTVATAFTKTEPVQTALFGIVLLGDRLSLPVALAILITRRLSASRPAACSACPPSPIAVLLCRWRRATSSCAR